MCVELARVHAQVFARQIKAGAVVEGEFEHARTLMQKDVGGRVFSHGASLQDIPGPVLVTDQFSQMGFNESGVYLNLLPGA